MVFYRSRVVSKLQSTRAFAHFPSLPLKSRAGARRSQGFHPFSIITLKKPSQSSPSRLRPDTAGARRSQALREIKQQPVTPESAAQRLTSFSGLCGGRLQHSRIRAFSHSRTSPLRSLPLCEEYQRSVTPYYGRRTCHAVLREADMSRRTTGGGSASDQCVSDWTLILTEPEPVPNDLMTAVPSPDDTLSIFES